MVSLIGIKFLAACATPTAGGLVCGDSLPKTSADSDTLNLIFLTAFAIIGALAFLFLVIGATRYITAGGNPENVQKARNQILYSIIGLIITSLAATIVNYVINKLK